MRPLYFLILLITFPLIQFAFKIPVKPDDVRILVNLYDHETKEAIIDAKVFLIKNKIIIDTFFTDSTGRFPETHLELDNSYRLNITKENYLGRIIEFDLRNIPAEDRYNKGWEVPFSLNMIKTSSMKKCAEKFDYLQNSVYPRLIYNSNTGHLDYQVDTINKMNSIVKECLLHK